MAYPYQKHIWVTREIIRREYLQNIEDGIYDEQQERLLAESLLDDAITAEENRAKSAENNLDLAIQAEETRAQGAESNLSDAITAEESRATGIESVLADDITALDTRVSNEYTRATTAESTLTTNLQAETTRATTAENALGTRVTTLEATATRAYKAAGSVLFADLPALAESRQGFVYNIRDDFTTTSDFIEGAGKDYSAGTDVAIVAVEGTPITYKYNVMSGFVDTSDFVKDTDYATTSNAGIVKPDGTTTSVDANGAISVIGGAGGGGSTWVGTCTSAASTQAKVATVDSGFTLTKGVRIGIKFTYTNTYSSTTSDPITLNVNGTGAKNIWYNNTHSGVGNTGTNTNIFGYANRYIFYVFDGTNWVWDGSGIDKDTTYSAMSVSELTTGTATSQRTVRADYLKSGIETIIENKTDVALSETSTNPVQNKVITVKKLGDFASISDVTVDSVTYHTYWQVTPTSSNDVYGVAVHPTNGRLYRIRSNSGTYSIQAYDKDNNTTTGDGIKMKVAKTGISQSSVTTSLAANTTMDNAIGTLLNNDVTLDKKKVAWEEQNVLGAKNLLPNTATTQTLNGVTYTVNSDGSISASNTATSLSILYIVSNYTLRKGRYILSGCPSNGGSETYNLFVNDSNGNIARDVGEGAVFELNSDTAIIVGIGISSGQPTSFVYKPMIRPASIKDDTYVPYAMTNRELTKKSTWEYVNKCSINGGTISLSGVDYEELLFMVGLDNGLTKYGSFIIPKDEIAIPFYQAIYQDNSYRLNFHITYLNNTLTCTQDILNGWRNPVITVYKK